MAELTPSATPGGITWSEMTFGFPYTSTMLVFASAVVLLAIIGDIDVFDMPGISAIGVSANETGEIGFALLLLVPAFIGDRRAAGLRSRDANLQTEQLRVVRSTMRTVQDIVNNNLNQLQHLRLEAEGCVPDASLLLFDQVIRDTATQLTTLGNIEVFVEKPMQMGPGVKFSRPTAVDVDDVIARLAIIQDVAAELAKCPPDVGLQFDLSSRIHQQLMAARRSLKP